jgi:GT2 family glycosyltransferase
LIPVVGIPYIVGPEFLERCIASLPRELVGKVVVIDNSWERSAPDLPDVHTVHMGTNLGVSASWNLIIKMVPKAPWWMIVNSDVEFIREDFDRFLDAMVIDPMVIMADLRAFGIKSEVIKTVGWFDENFAPAYCEDNDYVYRCKLLGIHVQKIAEPAKHYGSLAIRMRHDLRDNNNVTYAKNVEYYRAKWGGHMDHEVYETPFGNGGNPAHTEPDIERLASQAWIPAT